MELRCLTHAGKTQHSSPVVENIKTLRNKWFNMARVFVCCISMFTAVSGLSLKPCDQSVEAAEGGNFTFTCDQYNENVTWYYRSEDKPVQIIGTCGPSSCVHNDGIPPGHFTLAYLTSSSSDLILTNAATIRQFGGSFIRCGESAECQVDVVSNAVLPESSLNFTTIQWNLKGRVDVTSVYSALGRYSCEWTEIKLNLQRILPNVTLSLAPDTSNTSITQNRTGYCSFSKQLPSDPGTYNYTVTITPGNTRLTGGSRDIVRPESPVVTCIPSGHVLENIDVNCTCSTGSIGQPAGRLVWIKGGGFTNDTHTGNYGDASLVMTEQNLTLADHNITSFRCYVHWIHNVLGQVYTVLVGYGPSQLTFTLNNSTLSENQNLSLDCDAKGRPTPNITLVHQDRGAVLAHQSSPLSWVVSRGSCEDSGVYICTASNAVGPDTQTNVTVHVMCAPREDPVSSVPAKRPVLNYKGSPVSHEFNMTSYPAPTSFAFTYVGPDMISDRPELDVKDISLNVICQQRSRPLFIATCAVLVENVTSATAAGFYRLALTNDEGSGVFEFQVTIYGEPKDADNITQLTMTATPGESQSLTVLIVANPAPVLKNVAFLRGIASDKTNTTGTRSIDFINVRCAATELLHQTRCTITAIRPRESESGVYSVTLGNPFGEISYSVELRVTAPNTLNDTGNPFPTTAVGGGVAGAVVVIIAVLVGAVACRKCQGQDTRDGRSRSPKQRDDNNCAGLVVLEAVGDNSRSSEADDTYEIPVSEQEENRTYTGPGPDEDVGKPRGINNLGDGDGDYNAGFQDAGSSPGGNNITNAADTSCKDHIYQNI